MAMPPAVLFDTNVLVDLVLARPPWAADTGDLLFALKAGRGRACMAIHTVTTISYLVERERGRRHARIAVQMLLDTVEVVPLFDRDLHQAFGSDIADFEDALQVMAARSCGAQWIATRNLRDFVHSPIPALPPALITPLLTER